MGTIGSQVDEMPRTWLGRLIALFWMFCAIVFVAYFTAAATSSLTVKSLKGSIQGPSDLPGKSVVTLTGSTAAAFAKQHNAKVMEVADLAAAMKLVESGQVAAVVADAPVLQYYVANEGQGRVQLAGDVFRREFYGIVVANDSALRAPINTALLEMEEDGAYQALVDQWFKPDNSGG
jgi:polar amino acid transport system substrate-binding protein